ncbi:hypothetical protein P5658_26800 [Bacillus subtilis]|uniref:Uncharacterized protein n=1 Tax=Bacillus subtilis TaxID=1423 RepID=A0AC62A0K8_BACIU|nr:hypothetical protein BG30_15360 [Bacillus subtilis subsp. subtilis]
MSAAADPAKLSGVTQFGSFSIRYLLLQVFHFGGRDVWWIKLDRTHLKVKHSLEKNKTRPFGFVFFLFS